MSTKMFMQTRRQAKMNSSMTEDEIHAQGRILAAKRAEAEIPDLQDSYEGGHEAELLWSSNGPSEPEMEKYLEETKRMKIPIDVAHDILFDHKMDISASLKMLKENNLVSVDLVSSNDKLMIKSMETMLGKVENGITIQQNMFPGYDMTTIYNEAFNQNLGMLFCHPAKLETAKKTVSKQMRELEPKRESIGKLKKSRKSRISRNNTPEISSNTSSSGSSRGSSLEPKNTVPSLKLRRVRSPGTKGQNTVPIYATVTQEESSPDPVDTISKAKNGDIELLQQLKQEYEKYRKELEETPLDSFDASKPLPPVPSDDDIIILDSSPSNSQKRSNASSNRSSTVQILYQSNKEEINQFVKEVELALKTLHPRTKARIVIETTRSLTLATPLIATPPTTEIVSRHKSVIQDDSNVRNVVAARVEAIRKSSSTSKKRTRYDEEEYVLDTVKVASRSVTPPEAKRSCVRK